MFSAKLSGKELKEFAKFLETVEIDDFLKDKPAMEQLETLYKKFSYERLCIQKIKEA